MIMGMMAGQMRAAAGGLLWTPLNMAVVPQIYLDAQDSAVTDTSGFASAISNLGAMGASGDFLQGTTSQQPAILPAELNGKQVLSFDGSNDVLLGSSTAQKDIFRNKTAAWGFAVYKKRATDGSALTRRIFHCSNGSNANNRLSINASLTTGSANAPALSVQRLDADSPAALHATTSHSSSYVMILALINYSTRGGRVYTDGVLSAENTTLTTAGSTSNTASVNSLSIGARYDGILLADIDLAAIAISNTNPSTDDIDKLFGWAAHKYGLTASLPGGHPYKAVAPTI